MSAGAPILYSFRRCPYAMRARLALHAAGIAVEHREILLRDKPQAMLDASPKGTVPVLVLPAGRVLVIGNHAGQLPFDGGMVQTALMLEADPPRVARAMGEYWIPRIPFFNVLATRGGALVGTPENCVQLLEQEEAIMVFPEGQRGFVKTYKQRYQLQTFGLGFMRLALETDTPIVPIGIVGGEEQSPGLANIRSLGRLVGSPAFPITVTFPWLGPAGFIPLPVKYYIEFGEPLRRVG